MTLIEQKDSSLHPKAIQKTHFDQKSLGIFRKVKDSNIINAQNKVFIDSDDSSCSKDSKVPKVITLSKAGSKTSGISTILKRTSKKDVHNPRYYRMY